MAALIYGNKLAKAFGVKQLFNDLTLGVSENDRIGVIGPNGSGKSTLLKIFAGLEKPDDGTITRRQHLRIAYVPQQPNFRPEATVLDEMERAAIDSGVDVHEASIRAQEILGRTGFEDGSQLTGPLSGGWRKRLAIACGMIQEPEMMLLDEPTNHLDASSVSWLEKASTRSLVPSSRLLTTGIFWTTLRAGFWNWTAAGASRTKAIILRGWNRKGSDLNRKSAAKLATKRN